jgi:hypothetical protein
MKHTPGLWTNSQNRIEDASGDEIASVSYQRSGYVQANIRLISAAPDLLAACQWMFDQMAEPLHEHSDWAARYEQARAAIDKAVGK